MPKVAPGREYAEVRRGLSKALKEARLARGVSVKWLARKIGVSSNILTDWESGARNIPGVWSLVAIMRALHATCTISGRDLNIRLLPGMPVDVAIEGATPTPRKERSP